MPARSQPESSALKRLGALNSGTTGKWIIAALESVQASEGEGRVDPGTFHPSGLADECDAKLAFGFLGAPAVKSISARTQRIFDLGSGRDAYLKRDMMKSGISIVDPTKLMTNERGETVEVDRHIEIPHLYIRGELDDWVAHPVTGRKYVVDYKTMNPTEFAALDKVKPSHHIQVHPYMFARQTYEAYVLYENKADQEFKLKPANFDQTIWTNKIENRILRILDGLEHDYVTRTPGRCSYCPFYANGVCAANEIAALKARSGLYRT